jgi:hypothetical protein
MKKHYVRYTLLGVFALAALLACPPATDNVPTESIVGTWSASEQVELFDRTLTSTFELTFTASQVTLGVDTRDAAGALLHRLTASGTYTVPASQPTVTLSFVSAQQSADPLTTGSDPTSLADLSSDELADLATDFPSSLSYAITGTSMLLAFTGPPDLLFAKVP